MPRIATIISIVAVALFSAAAASTSDAKEPRDVVETFQTTLVEVMQESLLLGPDGRYERLAPAIDATFHVSESAELVSTPHWRKVDDSTRHRLTEAFRHLSISTLATRFDGYDGQEFVILDEKDGPRGTRIVRTEIVDADLTKRSVGYILKDVGGQWGIIDIVVDGGISELSVRRTEYRDVLRNNGIDGMIDAMNTKGDDLLAGS